MAGAWIDALRDGIVRIRSGRVAGANAAAAQLVGVEGSDKLVGHAVDALVRDLGRGLPALEAVAPAPPPVVCGFLDVDGDVHPVEVAVYPAEGGEDALWVVRDSGPEVRLGGELHRAERVLAGAERTNATLRDQLAAAEAEREELITVVSHELRTPVTVIAGFHKLVLSEEVGSINAEQRHFLLESLKSCRRLDAFIGNLVEAARGAPGEGEVELCEGSLEGVVTSVVDFLRPLLAERDSRVELSLPPDARRALFEPVRIEQVLTNLVANAMKHGPAGGRITISARRPGGAGPGRLEVSVCDEGPGVPAEARERIFHPWVRGPDRGVAGLGLGLAICRRIIDAHGGAIGVADRPAGGSRFWFTLPVAGGEASR